MARKSKRAKITTLVVEKLLPGEVVGDTDLPGFAVRRQQDARVYFVRKHANGRRHFVTIGELGKESWTTRKARQSALLIFAALKQGRDPAAERSKSWSMPTMAEFGDTFINEHGATLKTSTVAVYRSMLQTYVAPRDDNGQLNSGCLGRIRLDQVTAHHVVALHRSLKKTPRAANHVLALPSSIYTHAQAVGLVTEDHNLASSIKRFATPIWRTIH